MAARRQVRSRWGLAGVVPALLVMVGLWLAIAGGTASPAGASTPTPTVVDQVDGQATLLGVDRADGFSGGIKVTLNSATLSYASPQNVAPSGPGKAFVVFSMTDEPVNNPTVSNYDCSSFGDFAPLPGDRVTVVLPDGTSIATQHLGPTDRAVQGSRLLYGTYFAEVPANMTTAHLVIAPGEVDGAEFQGCTGNDATVTFATPVSFALSFSKLPPDTTPPPVTAAQANQASAASGGGGNAVGPVSGNGSGTGYGPVATGLAVGVTLLLVGAYLFGRRRHQAEAAGAGAVRVRIERTDWTAPGELRRPSPARSQGGVYTARSTPVTDSRVGSEGGREMAAWREGQGRPRVSQGIGGNGNRGAPGVAGAAVALGPVASIGPDGTGRGNGPEVGSSGHLGGESGATDQGEQQPEPAVLVGVLGPVKVTGWAKALDRLVTTDLLVFLAMHPNTRVSVEQLLVRLWPSGASGSDPSPRTLRSYISRLRAALGPEHLPEAFATGGYQLGPGVSSDWAQFCALVSGARTLHDAEARHALHRALALVRGSPFAGANRGTFEWTWEEVLPSTMEAAITDAAHDLCAMALEANDPGEAAWAARQGLRGVPGALVLQEDLLSAAAAAATGNRRRLEAVWSDLIRSPDNDTGLLEPVYDKLLAQLGTKDRRT